MSGQEQQSALLAALRRDGLDSVAGAFAYGGGEDLNKAGLGHRRRTRLSITDGQGRHHELYLKRYGRESRAVRWRRVWRHGWGRSAARVEADNIQAVAAAGVATMQALWWGQEPLRRGGRSALIVTAVPGEALERCLGQFAASHESADSDRLAEALGALAGRLHRAGIVHRDLYTSHVFLHETPGGFDLFLIDLARAFMPRWRRFRWRVKDLAQLRYSLPQDWSERHWNGLMESYCLQTGSSADEFEAAVLRKVRRMQRHAQHRGRRAHTAAVVKDDTHE